MQNAVEFVHEAVCLEGDTPAFSVRRHGSRWLVYTPALVLARRDGRRQSLLTFGTKSAATAFAQDLYEAMSEEQRRILVLARHRLPAGPRETLLALTEMKAAIHGGVWL